MTAPTAHGQAGAPAAPACAVPGTGAPASILAWGGQRTAYQLATERHQAACETVDQLRAMLDDALAERNAAEDALADLETAPGIPAPVMGCALPPAIAGELLDRVEEAANELDFEHDEAAHPTEVTP